MSEKCVVLVNCQNSWACDECNDYDRYYPIQRLILSPRQKEEKRKKKNEKLKRTRTERSRRGRANRLAGKRAEDSLVKMLKSWDIPCSKVPMGGVLKGSSLIGVEDNILAGDVRVKIGKGYKTVEVKRRVNLTRYYKLTEKQIVYIKDFCYLMGENDFKDLIRLGKLNEYVTMEDERFVLLHGFFNQDNTDFVAMTSPHQGFIFAVSKEVMEELH